MWGENTLAWGFKSPTCAVSSGQVAGMISCPGAGTPRRTVPAWGWQCGRGAHGIPPRAALRRGKDAHIGERSLRALSFRVGGERTVGPAASSSGGRQLPPLEAGVASTGLLQQRDR